MRWRHTSSERVAAPCSLTMALRRWASALNIPPKPNILPFPTSLPTTPYPTAHPPNISICSPLPTVLPVWQYLETLRKSYHSIKGLAGNVHIGASLEGVAGTSRHTHTYNKTSTARGHCSASRPRGDLRIAPHYPPLGSHSPPSHATCPLTLVTVLLEKTMQRLQKLEAADARALLSCDSDFSEQVSADPILHDSGPSSRPRMVAAFSLSLAAFTLTTSYPPSHAPPQVRLLQGVFLARIEVVIEWHTGIINSATDIHSAAGGRSDRSEVSDSVGDESGGVIECGGGGSVGGAKAAVDVATCSRTNNNN